MTRSGVEIKHEPEEGGHRRYSKSATSPKQRADVISPSRLKAKPKIAAEGNSELNSTVTHKILGVAVSSKQMADAAASLNVRIDETTSNETYKRLVSYISFFRVGVSLHALAVAKAQRLCAPIISLAITSTACCMLWRLQFLTMRCVRRRILWVLLPLPRPWFRVASIIRSDVHI